MKVYDTRVTSVNMLLLHLVPSDYKRNLSKVLDILVTSANKLLLYLVYITKFNKVTDTLCPINDFFTPFLF